MARNVIWVQLSYCTITSRRDCKERIANPEEDCLCGSGQPTTILVAPAGAGAPCLDRLPCNCTDPCEEHYSASYSVRTPVLVEFPEVVIYCNDNFALSGYQLVFDDERGRNYVRLKAKCCRVLRDRTWEIEQFYYDTSSSLNILTVRQGCPGNAYIVGFNVDSKFGGRYRYINRCLRMPQEYKLEHRLHTSVVRDPTTTSDFVTLFDTTECSKGDKIEFVTTFQLTASAETAGYFDVRMTCSQTVKLS